MVFAVEIMSLFISVSTLSETDRTSQNTGGKDEMTDSIRGYVVESFSGSCMRADKNMILWSSDRYTLFPTKVSAQMAIKKSIASMRKGNVKVDFRKYFRMIRLVAQ